MADPTPEPPVNPTPPDPARVPPAAGPGTQDFDELLARIPNATARATQIRELRALMVDRRPPRIAAVGRRGAGKSSLANALLGSDVLPVGAVEDTTQSAGWVEVSVQHRTLRWLDTPGLRAGATPERRGEVEHALASEAPDVVLWLCKAGQVDAGVNEDLDELRAVLAHLAKARPQTPAPQVIAVVTKVDELAPIALKTPPYDADETKRTHIDQAVEILRGHLSRAGIGVKAVVPVGAYQRFREGARVVNWRWNLTALSLAIFDALPQSAQVEAARAFEDGTALRRQLAMRLVGTATSVAFVVGATPLPVADLAILLPLQSMMLTSVVYIAGRSFGVRGVAEWFSGLGLNVGAGIGLREAVRALVKLVPGMGATVAGAVAATGTWALGIAAVRYFIDGVSIEASRAAFNEATRVGPPQDLREPEGTGESPTGEAPQASPASREGDG